MTLAASMSTADKVIICALAAVGLLAAIASSLVYLSRRPYKPGPRIEREVATALTDPAYEPYGPDLLDRIPRSWAYGDANRDAYPDDYVSRAQQHQPCEAYPCPHPQWRHESPVAIALADHCRCGAPWVCELAGPLNQPRQRDGDDFNRVEGGW